MIMILLTVCQLLLNLKQILMLPDSPSMSETAGDQTFKKFDKWIAFGF